MLWYFKTGGLEKRQETVLPCGKSFFISVIRVLYAIREILVFIKEMHPVRWVFLSPITAIVR